MKVVRLSGLGGQGVVLAAQILGAAAARSGLSVVQTQTYGSAARGGASRADVILDTEAIDELAPRRLDLLVAMSQPAHDRYLPSLASDGALVYDSDLVRPGRKRRTWGYPATRTAREELGSPLFANMAMLGFIVGLAEPVDAEAVRQEIKRRVKRRPEENLTAFAVGLEAGAEKRPRRRPARR